VLVDLLPRVLITLTRQLRDTDFLKGAGWQLDV
jgi:hypothetical protein